MSALRECDRCGNFYHWEASTAELKMTYCSSLCESRAMVPISVLLRAERDPEELARIRVRREFMARAEELLLAEAGGGVG